MSQVEYRDIPGFCGYRVGNDGSVWTRRPRGRGKIDSGEFNWRRIGHADGYGRFVVTLSRGGKYVHVFVHHVVLEAFVGPRPLGMECCHNDGNPMNNRLENLRWDNHQSNMADTVRHGTQCRGQRSHHAKLSDSQAKSIKELVSSGLTRTEVAKIFGVSIATASRIVAGKKWKHIA